MSATTELKNTPVPPVKMCMAKAVEADYNGWIVDGDFIAFYSDGTYRIVQFNPIAEEQMKKVAEQIKATLEEKKQIRERLAGRKTGS